MELTVQGSYFEAGNSAAIDAVAKEYDDGVIVIVRADSSNTTPDTTPVTIRQASSDDYAFGMVVPGVAVELSFHDGALFQPKDKSVRWQGLAHSRAGLLAKLESNRWSVLFAAVCLPLVLWWSVTIGIPGAAESLVSTLPQSVADQAGKQSFEILERTFLDESTLAKGKQKQVLTVWQEALDQLGVSDGRYQLYFRYSEALGANAFALPDGTIIVTDELVTLLEDKKDALLAVLLHEIGHVEHQHGMKLVARSAATSIFFAIFFGDIDGAGEMIIGASASLLDSAFSRDMEAEADAYSVEKLKQLGKSPKAFALAMESLMTLHDGDPGHPLMRYLRSHPLSQDRVDAANKAAGE